MANGVQKIYYTFIYKAGVLLHRLMWKLLALRSNGAPIHPKHLALPQCHHHWYVAGMKPGRRVLDLGCDRGGHTAPLAKAGATVVGVEKSKAALASAVQTKGVEYVRSDLEQALPFADASFDAVLALDVIEHLHHRDAFLLEIVRVLKPQGQIYLSAPNRATHWKTTARQIGLFDVSDPDHKIEYTLDELKAELERAGLTPLTIDPVVFDTPYALWIDFLGAISHKAYRAMWMRKRRRAIADPDQSTGFRIVATKKNQRPGAEND